MCLREALGQAPPQEVRVSLGSPSLRAPLAETIWVSSSSAVAAEAPCMKRLLAVLFVGVAASCGGPPVDTSQDHAVVVPSLPPDQLREVRGDLDEAGCKRVLDLRQFVSDLARRPDLVATNDTGNRVCTWNLGPGGQVAVTTVDRSNGLLDSVNVTFDIAEERAGAQGLSLVAMLSDAVSVSEIKNDEVIRWVIDHHSEDGASRGFGGAYVRILGAVRDGARQLVLVRVG